jgi:hypothetical protein
MTDSADNSVVEDQKAQLPDLPSLLKGVEGAPSPADIEKWKQTFGEVFVSGFSETELFVWRTVARREYVEIQKRLVQAQGDPLADPEKELVDLCVLWASNRSTLDTKAGSVSTLYEQIMTNSNFMPPAMASVFVAKL